MAFLIVVTMRAAFCLRVRTLRSATHAVGKRPRSLLKLGDAPLELRVESASALVCAAPRERTGARSPDVLRSSILVMRMESLTVCTCACAAMLCGARCKLMGVSPGRDP
jgi:hypothetical protein